MDWSGDSDYVDFEIGLELVNDPANRELRYEVAAKSTEGERSGPLKLPFFAEGESLADADFEEVQERISNIVGEIDKAVRLGRPPNLPTRGVKKAGVAAVDGKKVVAVDPEVELAKFGNALHRALFNGRGVQRLYDQTMGRAGQMRIRLKFKLTDPFQRALFMLPWESLKEEAEADLQFLSAESITPLVRDVRAGAPTHQDTIDGPLNVLLVTAHAPDMAPLKLEEEQERIETAFEHSKEVHVETLNNPTWDELEEKLDDGVDYHIIHYMGHGDYDAGSENGRGRGGMLMLRGRESGGSDQVDNDMLAGMLRNRATRLFFINACNTAVVSRDAEAAFSGLATRMLEAGVPAVIAMQFEIADPSAVKFAETFYDRIADGQPIDSAVSAARRTLLNMSREGNKLLKGQHWLTPVLYMREGTSGRLLAPRSERASRPPEPAPRPTDVADEPNVRQAVESASPYAQPEPSEPPPDVAGNDIALWMTEFQNRIVLNWRVQGDVEAGDLVALFDEEPKGSPLDWVGIQYESAHKKRLFWTDKRAERGKYYVAYLRYLDKGYEIIRSEGPFEG